MRYCGVPNNPAGASANLPKGSAPNGRPGWEWANTIAAFPAKVKAGAGGKQTATIKMGADTFAVDTSSLAVASGAATVNASQDEIKTMLKAKK